MNPYMESAMLKSEQVIGFLMSIVSNYAISRMGSKTETRQFLLAVTQRQIRETMTSVSADTLYLHQFKQ